MKIEYLFFIACLFMIFWIYPKIQFIQRANLSARTIRLLLVFKMLTGIICAFLFEKIIHNTDYLSYNNEGKLEYELLLLKPVHFFSNIINDWKTYGTGGLFESSHSFWAYLRSNLLFKCIAVLNLITGGNFYLNSIAFSSLVFWGHIAFYRIFSEIYNGQKLIILIASFGLPSLVLYTSCVHKDGIIFLNIGLISYALFRIVENSRSIKIKYILLICLGITTIFLFRNYVVIAIVPAMLSALLCKLLPYKKWYVLLITYSVLFLLFFLSGLSQSFLNLPAAVVQRKADFAALGAANTNIPMNELYPTAKSFIANLPQAINHYFFRPYPWEFSKPSILLTALELLVYQIIFLAFILYRKKPTTPLHVFNVFGIAFIFNMALIIGYTIPNIGAIVRYRSVFWIFLLCPLLCNTDWKRLLSFRKKNSLIDN